MAVSGASVGLGSPQALQCVLRSVPCRPRGVCHFLAQGEDVQVPIFPVCVLPHGAVHGGVEQHFHHWQSVPRADLDVSPRKHGDVQRHLGVRIWLFLWTHGKFTCFKSALSLAHVLCARSRWYPPSAQRKRGRGFWELSSPQLCGQLACAG